MFFEIVRIFFKFFLFPFLAIVTACSFGTSTITPVIEKQHRGFKTNDDISSQSSNADKGVSIRVMWSISNYVVGENATWKEDDARKMLFKTLDIDMDNGVITFDGRTCRNVTFKRKIVNAKEYV